jgi:hypothetical protein
VITNRTELREDAMTATTIATARKTGRSLVDDELLDRLVTFLVNEEQMTRCHAILIMDQALAFLGTLAQYVGAPLSPSKKVDPGWHAFVLHTREYDDWCQRVAGRFIHHNPFKDTIAPRDGVAVARTVEAMAAAGYAIDPDLWNVTANCNAPTCDGDDGRPYNH